MYCTAICEPLTRATPLTSPVGLKSSMPRTLSISVGSNSVLGRPVDMGVGSVTMNFICATPPGGGVSFGMNNETCCPELLPLVPLPPPGPGPPCPKSAPAARRASAAIDRIDIRILREQIDLRRIPGDDGLASVNVL